MGSKFGINREVDKINEVSKVSIDKLRLDSLEGEVDEFLMARGQNRFTLDYSKKLLFKNLIVLPMSR